MINTLLFLSTTFFLVNIIYFFYLAINKENEFANNIKICCTCCAENDISSRLCKNCGQNGSVKQQYSIPNSQKATNLYEVFTAIDSTINSAKVMTGEPDMCNPNSYVNISRILRNLGHRSSISRYVSDGKRHFVWKQMVLFLLSSIN